MSDAEVMNGAQTTACALVSARREARVLAEYPGEMPMTLEAAYRIQDAAIRHHGGVVAGWKVGRIQPPLAQTLGETRLAGPIFANAVHPASPAPEMSIFVGGFGAVEAEFLYRLGTVPEGRTEWSVEEALDCVTAVHIGFEIASSPFVGINQFGPTVTASDFGNNNGLVVGPAITDWQKAGIDSMTVTTRVDDGIVGSGQGASFPGGTGRSVAFLLENLAQRKITIAPGTWVSTGAVTGVHEIATGSHASAAFGNLSRIECRIVTALPCGEG